MQLRDYFAGQALIGLLAQQSNTAAMSAVLQIATSSGESVESVISRSAYKFADAMLAERMRGV